jgi:hypothetical protein
VPAPRNSELSVPLQNLIKRLSSPVSSLQKAQDNTTVILVHFFFSSGKLEGTGDAASCHAVGLSQVVVPSSL